MEFIPPCYQQVTSSSCSPRREAHGVPPAVGDGDLGRDAERADVRPQLAPVGTHDAPEAGQRPRRSRVGIQHLRGFKCTELGLKVSFRLREIASNGHGHGRLFYRELVFELVADARLHLEGEAEVVRGVDQHLELTLEELRLPHRLLQYAEDHP